MPSADGRRRSPRLLLWKSVQDDRKVNGVETAGMIAVFGLTLYFLAMHG